MNPKCNPVNGEPHTLNQDDESLIITFFPQQLKTKELKDWSSQILKDLSDFDIHISMEEIRNISEAVWGGKNQEKIFGNGSKFFEHNTRK